MENLLNITLGAALRERAIKSADKESSVFPDRGLRYTFSEIDKRADGLAKGLLASGFRRGDHIGIWANNVPEWPIIFYAAARVGVVVVPINSNCKLNEIRYILGHADLNGLFIIDKYRDTDYAKILYQLIPELKNSKAGRLQSGSFPCLKMVITIDKTQHEGMCLLEDLIQAGNHIDNNELKSAESKVCGDDTICIIYTSGTTGIPKGVMLTHNNIINNVYFSNKSGVFGENDILLNPLPFFYVTALTDCIAGSVIHGFKLVVIENFDIEKCLEVVQKEKCSWILAVPTMYMAMLNHPLFDTFSLKSVAYCCTGGAVCPPELMKTIMQKMCTKGLYLAYGLTETSPNITTVAIEDTADPRLITAGDPLPGIELSIRDPANNAECPINVQGEICTRGYHVMKGYYKMEEATREAIDKDGWFHTGDLGHLLPNGCLIIDGRIKELIIRGGENVYPREVENLLLAMPGVQDVQAAGIPSEKYGEEVGVFIIPKQNVSITEKDVMDFCKNKISFYKAPKYIFFVDSFPLSANGKVQKFKLSEWGLIQVKGKGTAT
jgi:fatty-acyl-CoA synthase